MTRWLLAPLTAATFAVTTPAVAAPPERVEARGETRSYAGQVILVGYSGLGLAVHGFLSDSRLLMWTGGFTWAFGGTMVHAAHGNAVAAVASPFITAGAPLCLALLAAQSRDTRDLALPLSVIAALAGPLIDGFALGRERVSEASKIAIVPTVSRDRVALSLGGSF